MPRGKQYDPESKNAVIEAARRMSEASPSQTRKEMAEALHKKFNGKVLYKTGQKAGKGEFTANTVEKWLNDAFAKKRSAKKSGPTPKPQPRQPKGLDVDAGLKALDELKQGLLANLRQQASSIEAMQRRLEQDIGKVASKLKMGVDEVRADLNAK